MLKYAVQILQVGFVGFAFLLVFLSFRLLRSEQKRSDEARPDLLRAIRHFTYLTVVVVALGAVATLAEKYIGSAAQTKSTLRSEQAGVCRDGLDRLVHVDAKVAKDYDTLRRAVHDAASGCQAVLRELDKAR